MKHKVVVSDALGAEGLELLAREPDIDLVAPGKMARAEALAALKDADALVVRSATRVDRELLESAPRLQVVVRAGAGIDNIDLDAATARGVVVMNTPGGNTNAATEHTLALLLSLIRHIPQANRSLLEGRWERERFGGSELLGKTLGVVGLGRIGSAVAERARAFKMEIVGYDPFVSKEVAAERGVELLALDELLARSDVVTLHLPLEEGSKHLIGSREIGLMKRGARLVNCARGGLVDEAALLAALDAGRLAGAALDVFESEPGPDPKLVGHPLVVATPHLGASTQEAQAGVGIQAARQLLGVLRRTSFENAVNMPLRDPAALERLAPYLRLAEKMGSFLSQVRPDGVREASIDVASTLEDTAAITLGWLKGLLRPSLGEGVNYVNAPFLARERGIRVTEQRSAPAPGYTALLTATLDTDHGRAEVKGVVLGDQEPRFVGIDGFRIEAIPEGNLLVIRSLDRPGVIGLLGTKCGEAALNISEFRLGRKDKGGEALSVLTLDTPPTAEVLDCLRGLPNVLEVRAVKL